MITAIISLSLLGLVLGLLLGTAACYLKVEGNPLEAEIETMLPGSQCGLANKLGVSADLSGMEDKALMVAHIKEGLCIGCTRCFKRCPTDAILGASKQIHAVIGDACTGCEKCIDICHWPKPAIFVAA